MNDRAGYVGALVTDWRVAATPPGAIAEPAALAGAALAWTPSAVPTTAAAALRAAGTWSLDGPARRFDDEDWWWRARLPAADGPATLCLDGVATLADVWLDGAPVATIDGMFAPTRIPLPAGSGAELAIRCRSLTAALAARRPRPRWRAPMVEHQQLRWFRTTLLGRTPGWSPPAAAVGPWRPVRIERPGPVTVDELVLAARVDGTTGVLDVACRLGGADRGELAVTHAGRELRAPLATAPDGRSTARIELPDVARWWPHTHGAPIRYPVRLVAGDVVLELGAVGFRTIEVDPSGGGFALIVNGARVFARGACWTPLDPVALSAPAAAYDRALAQAATAGMNLVRVCGPMVYEPDDFHVAADARGLLVWQDLMFANLAYPEDDPTWAATALREVRGELARRAPHPSLAVVCGNSEVAQQAAMWGAARGELGQALFAERFADLAAALAPGAVYWPSSAWGGDPPMRADVGTTSYYGVGAYLRPLEDARRAEVRFATECLAFAQVGAARGLPGGEAARVHAPAWKARTPRDLGAGWDFDDVRDHYLSRVFAVDPVALRYADHERYLELSRVVTGEVMAQVFGEWRRARSTCAGGLVWFLRDLWPGAGWGVVDAHGEPKAAYYYLARALAPIAVHISDEGGNGLAVHVANDRPDPVAGALHLGLWLGDAPAGSGRIALAVGARSAVEVPALAAFEGFRDLGHAYRFGPPTCDLVVATLEVAGAAVAQAFHFPVGPTATARADLGVAATLGADRIELASERFAQSCAIDLPGWELDDNYFHLAPGARRVIGCRRIGPAAGARGTVKPLNATTATVLATS